MQRVSEYLASSGHEVTVATTTAVDHDALYDARLRHCNRSDETLNGVRIRRFAPARVDRPAGSAEFSCPGLRRYVSSLGTGDFDLVSVACFPFGNLIEEGRRAADRAAAPMVLIPFLHTHALLSRVFQTDRLRALAHMADRIICQTDHEAGFLAGTWRVPRHRLEIVGVGVDPPMPLSAGPATGEAGTPASTPFILFLGTHDRLKGTIALLEAAAGFDDRVLFILAGGRSATFESYLEAADTRLPDNVRMLGRVDDGKKQELLGRMTCLAVPSVAESFGQVYLEAWLQRKPVIAARHGVSESLVARSNGGLLVDFGDVGQLQDAIRTYLDSPADRIRHGLAGYAMAQQYLWPALLARLSRILGSLAGDGEPRALPPTRDAKPDDDEQPRDQTDTDRSDG